MNTGREGPIKKFVLKTSSFELRNWGYYDFFGNANKWTRLVIACLKS